VIEESQAVSVGEVLADARHELGFTVAQVSHHTRVRESIVRAIERDDYVLSGTDAHARRDIRVIALSLGVDPDPLIRAFDAAYRSLPEPVPDRAIPPPIPFGPVGRDGAFARIEPRRTRWVAVVAALILAAAGFAVYHFAFAGPAGQAPSAPQAALSHSAAPASSVPASSLPAASVPAAPVPAAPVPAAADPAALTPAGVMAFGPRGTADGDNPQLAPLAVDGNPATAWITGGYASPRFANAQPGTGLLVDMGQVVTITSAEVTLGSAPGADFQMRAGNTPSLAQLPPVAVATNASGVMAVRFAAPVHARYVLIWFTKLPPAASGVFQASVYNVTVQGSRR
jgi:cytoskeletal protein RodZ